MTHSKGPWFYHDHPTETAQVTNSDAGHGLGLRIADVWCTDLEHGAENAQLIAAAPDLLQACKLAWSNMGHFGERLAHPSIGAAIAKAEGTTS